MAHTYLKHKNYSAAIEEFQTISTQNTARKAGAEWFLALAYLEEGRVEEAQNVLNRIIEQSSHPNRNKANTLLEDLNSFWRKWVWE